MSFSVAYIAFMLLSTLREMHQVHDSNFYFIAEIIGYAKPCNLGLDVPGIVLRD